MTCDILFVNGRIYNSSHRRFFDGWMALRGEKVLCIGVGEPYEEIEAAQTVDLGGRSVVPGLVDVHMHIESSMLTPLAYAAQAVAHGVTTVVSEPHEIANVGGLDAVLAMIEAGKGAPIDIYYGIPSCVPSTSTALETSGGDIGVDEVLSLAGNPDVKCLGEIMNTNSVLNEPDGKTNELIRAFKQAAPGKPVEGHVPRIVGSKLAEYMMSGVDSDHTEHTLEELKDRWFFGMQVQLQEKTLSADVINYLKKNPVLIENTALVTDDVMADEIIDHGILDDIVRKAVALGLPLEDAVYCASATAAKRMRLFDRGYLRPGYLADFVILADDEKFIPAETWKRGRKVYSREQGVNNALPEMSWPENLLNSVKLQPLYQSDFTIKTEREGFVNCRVAQVHPHRTQTTEIERKVEARDGELLFEEAGVCQFAVFERHGKNGNRAQGLVDGCVINSGAVATTYSHDSHNLCVLGTNRADMAAAANEVISMRGGFAVVDGGVVVAKASLPIGGILSEKSAEDFAKEIGAVTQALVQRGYTHEDPIMSLCVLALPVSPALKFSDVGIIDVLGGKLVELEK